MDAHRTLALQEAGDVGHAELGRDAQAQVGVVGQGVPLQQAGAAPAAQLAQGRHAQAIAQLTQLLARHPDHVPAHFMLGSALAKSKQYDAAIAAYDRALALRPQLADRIIGELQRIRIARPVFIELSERIERFRLEPVVLALSGQRPRLLQALVSELEGGLPRPCACAPKFNQ